MFYTASSSINSPSVDYAGRTRWNCSSPMSASGGVYITADRKHFNNLTPISWNLGFTSPHAPLRSVSPVPSSTCHARTSLSGGSDTTVMRDEEDLFTTSFLDEPNKKLNIPAPGRHLLRAARGGRPEEKVVEKNTDVTPEPSITTSRRLLSTWGAPRENSFQAFRGDDSGFGAITTGSSNIDPYGSGVQHRNHFSSLSQCSPAASRTPLQRVIINVAGFRFETQLSTLDRYPNTLLGCKEKRRSFWDMKRHEFFFDRHRQSFAVILHYYQSGGRLTVPNDVPTDVFYEELLFYEMGHEVINQFLQENGLFALEQETARTLHQPATKLWTLLEYPHYNNISRLFACVAVSIILLVTASYCMETLPQYRNLSCEPQPHHLIGNYVSTTSTELSNVTSTRLRLTSTFFMIEAVCMLVLAVEFFIRLLCAPHSLTQHFSATNTILDVIIFVSYIGYVVSFQMTDDCAGQRKDTLAYHVRCVLRFLRVLRVFKLAKYVTWLQVIAETLRRSIREIFTFICFLGICVTFFSTLVYLAERYENEEHMAFSSIPDSFWWAIISMTTVGYGDVAPRGIGGKIVGSICVVAAVFTVALPVPIMVANFNNVYKLYQIRTNLEKQEFRRAAEQKAALRAAKRAQVKVEKANAKAQVARIRMSEGVAGVEDGCGGREASSGSHHGGETGGNVPLVPPSPCASPLLAQETNKSSQTDRRASQQGVLEHIPEEPIGLPALPHSRSFDGQNKVSGGKAPPRPPAAVVLAALSTLQKTTTTTEPLSRRSHSTTVAPDTGALRKVLGSSVGAPVLIKPSNGLSLHANKVATHRPGM